VVIEQNPDIVQLLRETPGMLYVEGDAADEEACFSGKSIFELDIRNTSGANIIGLKRKDKSYLINPLPETTLTSSDQLFALGTKAQISHLRKTIYTDGT
jgi:voltage-gated potassium channel